MNAQLRDALAMAIMKRRLDVFGLLEQMAWEMGYVNSFSRETCDSELLALLEAEMPAGHPLKDGRSKKLSGPFGLGCRSDTKKSSDHHRRSQQTPARRKARRLSPKANSPQQSKK